MFPARTFDGLAARKPCGTRFKSPSSCAPTGLEATRSRGNGSRGRQAAVFPRGRQLVPPPLLRPEKGVDGHTLLRSVIKYRIPTGAAEAASGRAMHSNYGQLLNARRCTDGQ